MNKMEHTKGPWRIIHEFNVVDSEGRLIAACGGHSNNRQAEKIHNENIINARLITACPDMYEALIALVRHANCEPGPIPEELWKRADKALEKAEGK